MPTVYVIQNDNNKDLSDAKRYGDLEAVFFNPRKPYDTNFLLDMAHKVLSKITKYDYILMLGDPALCGVCTAVAREYCDEINILSWDRRSFSYLPLTFDFADAE